MFPFDVDIILYFNWSYMARKTALYLTALIFCAFLRILFYFIFAGCLLHIML